MTTRKVKAQARGASPSFCLSRRGTARALHCEQVELENSQAATARRCMCIRRPPSAPACRAFSKAFARQSHTVCYSVKANSNLTVLRLLACLGCGFDVVSGGELERVLSVGPEAAAGVVFSGVGKTAVEMDLALEAGILIFNVESEAELELLATRAARLKKTARVAIPRQSGRRRPKRILTSAPACASTSSACPSHRHVSSTAARPATVARSRWRQRAHRLADHRREALWRDHGARAHTRPPVARRRTQHQLR